MIQTYFRSSSMTAYEFCQQQFFINYILGIERKAGQKAEMGTILHKTMEYLAVLKKQSQDDTVTSLVLKDDILGEFSIPRNQLLSQSLAEGILNKVFQYYTAKTTFGYTSKDFGKISGWMNTVLTYANGLFDPRKRNILATESHFDFVLPYDWAKYNWPGHGENGKDLEGNLAIKGTIDLLTQSDDGKIIEIIDWKTGKRYDWGKGKEKTYDDLCKDRQLMLYWYAARRMHPEAEQVLLTIYFIVDGGPFTIAFEPEQEKEVENNLRSHFEKVKHNNMPRLVSQSQTSFKCTKLCDYYKNKWPGTEENQCMFIHKEIKRIGINAVIKKYSSKGHSVDNYASPGE